MATYWVSDFGQYNLTNGTLGGVFSDVATVQDGEADTTFEQGDGGVISRSDGAVVNAIWAYLGTATYNGAVLPVFLTPSNVVVVFASAPNFVFPNNFSDFTYSPFGTFTLNAPTQGVNTGLTLAEGATGTITSSQLDFNDIDQSDPNITYTVTSAATNGTLRLNGNALGVNGTFTQDDINNGRLTFAHNGSETTSASFGFKVADLQGSVVSNQTFAFTFTPVNDAPTGQGLPASITVVEDVASNIDLSGITIADVDASGGNITVTLTASAGTLAATSGGGVTVGGSGSALTLTGTLAALNAFLDTASNITYTSAADANGNGAATITVTINDNGNTGGPANTVTAGTVTVDITSVNDAPTATGLTQSLPINEDAAAANLFTAAPTVDDIDSTSITATLTLADPSAGSLTGGGFAATANPGEYTFIGTPAAVQTALASVQFTPAANYNGSTSVSVSITDGNAPGTTGVQPSGSVSIVVSAVNDAPTGADKTITTNEDTAYTFKAADFGFSDIDGNSLAAVEITQVSGAGTLKLGNAVVTAGQTITAASLAGLTFTPTANANGANFASIKFQVQDNGGTSNGGINTDASANTITFNFAAVNDAPTAVVASNVRGPIAENASTKAAIKFADLDITDVDGGTNVLSLAGADASLFQILGGDLYLKAGAKLDFETNPKLDVTVIVNDASVGGAIDAQKALSFSVTDIIESYIGNSAANTLVGTSSDETFIGNGGADRMTGGGGRDTFVFKALTDTAPGSPSFITNPTIAWQSGLGLRDIITDFTPGLDKIDLSLIDASTKVAGNQAFAFNGTGAFSSNPGSLIYRVFDLAGTANDRTIVYADVNGDRLADMQIELTGLKTLQATDFVL